MRCSTQAELKQHDIDYIRADKHPMPIDQIRVAQEQLSVLGYFSRDLRALSSAFYREGAGTLNGKRMAVLRC